MSAFPSSQRFGVLHHPCLKLGGIIGANTGYKAGHTYLKYDSRQFVPSEILAKIREVLHNG